MTYCIPCTIHILHIHLYVLILSYTLCFRILFVLFFYWFKTNTFISYLYFSYYVNFYLIFHISRRNIRLILLLSYHILSYVFIYVFMCFHILYFSYTFLFSLLSVLYLFISFSCTILCTFYILYSCTVHVLFSSTYIYVLFSCYTFHMIVIYCAFHILYFSYAFHILYLSYTFRVIATLFLVLVYLSYTFLFHILYFSYAFHILYLFIYFSCTMYFSYTVILYITSCSCNCLYFHRIAVLCFSYHIIYSIHVISFLVSCLQILRSGYGK